MRIEFSNVGRDKLSWTENLPNATYDELFKAVKRKRALASNSIEFDYGEDNRGGGIFAGFRAVGAWRRLD